MREVPLHEVPTILGIRGVRDQGFPGMKSVILDETAFEIIAKKQNPPSATERERNISVKRLFLLPGRAHI